MALVVYIDSKGSEHRVEGRCARSLMQLARDEGVAGIIGECGGAGSCGTCHGYVTVSEGSVLPPLTEGETFMLEGLDGVQANSRLCCQIMFTDELAGLTVSVPGDDVART